MENEPVNIPEQNYLRAKDCFRPQSTICRLKTNPVQE